MNYLSTLFSYSLVLLMTFLFLWGLSGALEYFTDIMIFGLPLQNPDFPNGTQLIQWLLLIAAGLTFLVGYYYHWKHLPTVMTIIFAMLFTLCAIQTFDFLANSETWKVHYFVAETIAYIIISVYLYKSNRFKA